MKGKISLKISLLVILFVVLYSNGCTVTLGMIGKREDILAPDIADTVSVSELEKVKAGSQVIVNLKDGTHVCGKYLGIDSIPNEKYAEKYAETQKQIPEGSFLPSIGDTITVSTKIVTQSNIKFCGFDNENIILSFIESDNPEKLKLEFLESIEDKHGNLVKGKVIRNLLSEGKIPTVFLSEIAIEVNTGEEDEWGEEIIRKKFIDKNDIDQIQIKAAKHAMRNLLIAGCLVDSAIIAGTFALILYILAEWVNYGLKSEK